MSQLVDVSTNYVHLRTQCASCSSTDTLRVIYDFGEVPLAGDFPKKNQLNEVSVYQLSLLVCERCALVQTNSIISPNVLFSDYRYKSSIGLTKHFESYVQWFKTTFGNEEDYKILEIGCNDGVLMRPLIKEGYDVVGVDPARNIIQTPLAEGMSIYCDFFSSEFVRTHKLQNTFDFILANNSFAHIDNIKDVVEAVATALKSGGHLIIEVHYLLNLISQFQYDNVYHEHIYYYSLTALDNLLNPYGLHIVNFEDLDVHAGSIRVIIQKDGQTTQPVLDRKATEMKMGITTFPRYDKFSGDVTSHSEELRKKIRSIKSEGYRIIGYGASGRANMLCNTLRLTQDDVEYILDESPERYDRFIPQANIPIINASDKLNHITGDNVVIVIFAWNYANMIINKLRGRGFKFLLPLPEIRIVDDTYVNQNTL